MKACTCALTLIVILLCALGSPSALADNWFVEDLAARAAARVSYGPTAPAQAIGPYELEVWTPTLAVGAGFRF